VTGRELTPFARTALTLGSVVLCLDGDDAGIAAVERVCSSGLLASVSSRLATEIRVATLPEGRKDPAECIELHQNSIHTQAGEDFRTNVIDTSVEWTDWYLNRIMGRFDPSVVRGDVGSFGDVFERVANFLATFRNAADRTERACQVAASLADIMSSNFSTGPVSNTVRIQLESDLVDKVSRIAMSKETATRRLESVEGGSEIEIKAKLSNLSRGLGPSGSDELEKLSSKAIGATPTKPSTRPIKKKSSRSSAGSKKTPKVAERRGYKPPKDMVKQDVIPHHQGFAFKHESDQEWMQSDGENVSGPYPGSISMQLSLHLIFSALLPDAETPEERWLELGKVIEKWRH
jgi:DNA primase